MTTAILRAGDLADRATFYRHDLAFADNPTLERNPHRFMVSTDVAAFSRSPWPPRSKSRFSLPRMALKSSTQNRHTFFELPIVLPLPEALNFITP